MLSQQHYQRVFSFEFFPPKTSEGHEKLKQTRSRLVGLNPRFFSVTYGAGGSTQDQTFNTVLAIQQETGVDAAPHLSCVGSSREMISEILDRFIEKDIKHIVAIRGDLPSGMMGIGEFSYANELVEFIRTKTGDHFQIEVAAYPEFHPQATNATIDLGNFKRKVEAGADSAITQYFYNPDAYFRFVDSCEKLNINLPIVPGIMPITNYKQLVRFSDNCGAEVPRWIRKRLEDFGDDIESIRSFGIEVTTELCRQLLAGGAPGLHIYTMNRADASVALWRNLDL